jgi:hypothetical protein
VCGSYTFKDEAGISVAVYDAVAESSRRIEKPFERRGLVPASRTLPMGCAVIDLKAVRNLPKPSSPFRYRDRPTVLRTSPKTPFLPPYFGSMGIAPRSTRTFSAFTCRDARGIVSVAGICNEPKAADRVSELAVSDEYLKRYPAV